MLLDTLFLFNSVLAVVLAVLMVSQKNPIYSALFLIAVFFPLAFIFVLLWAPFVAIIQILVYAGAIMVLFVFVIMMINLERHELEVERGRIFKIIAGLVALMFVGVGFYAMAISVRTMQNTPVDVPQGFGSTASIGHLIFDRFPLQFTLVSVLILVAFIGAVVLAKKRLD